MNLNIDDLPADVQRKIKKEQKLRVRKPKEDTQRHALAVAAMLLDDRKLTITDAKRVLRKAITLLR